MPKKIIKNKKGFTIGDLAGIAISLGVAVIVIAVVATIVQQLRDDQTSVNTSARNVTDFGLESINTLASFLPLVALAAVGAVVIGIIIQFFLRKVE